ncbi:MAG: lytic transglycosylase domain-containing protein [Ruminococcaceae bacterium]|nr:lytic transglycosylase domain-containing protein [Oscillospiraceae bacterium]
MSKLFKNICAFVIIIGLSVSIGFFAQHIKTKYDMASHPRDFAEFVEKYSQKYKVPEKICYAVIKCESGFDSAAKSRSGAIGLMQIMPDTFTYLCSLEGANYETGMLYDPETNIRFGTFYLSVLYERFGIWETAFAAYNAGPSRVDGWIKDGKADDAGRLTEIPIEETETYVTRVNRALKMYENLYYQ